MNKLLDNYLHAILAGMFVVMAADILYLYSAGAWVDTLLIVNLEVAGLILAIFVGLIGVVVNMRRVYGH